MNEVQLIRAQLAAERQNASTVANACATALGRRNAVALSSGSSLEEFRQACVDYLVCVLAWFEDRDQRLTDLWHARLAPGDAARRALEQLEHSKARLVGVVLNRVDLKHNGYYYAYFAAHADELFAAGNRKEAFVALRRAVLSSPLHGLLHLARRFSSHLQPGGTMYMGISAQ